MNCVLLLIFLFLDLNALFCVVLHRHTGTASCKCNNILDNFSHKINPFKEKMKHYVPTKPFASVYLKCGACLAIANEIDTIFKKTIDSKNVVKQTDIVNALKERTADLCLKGFENYDLRKFKHFQSITDNFKCSGHINTNMDGKWTETLREVCFRYKNSMDFQHLLNQALRNTSNIFYYLCRGEATFRDCSGLNVNDSCTLHEDTNVYQNKKCS